MLRNQRGATFIGIILVLVMLIVLAKMMLTHSGWMQTEKSGIDAPPGKTAAEKSAGRTAAAVQITLSGGAADKVADGAMAAAQSALSMGYAAYMMKRPGAPAGPAAACTAVTLQGPTVQSVSCTGDAWVSGAKTVISVSYTGGSHAIRTGTWTVP